MMSSNVGAPFGQYAQGIQHIEYGSCVIGPEKVFVALVQPRIEHSMPAPRGHPCKGIAIGNQWVPLDFENLPILNCLPFLVSRNGRQFRITGA